MESSPLTDKQKQILEDICEYQDENKAIPAFSEDMRNLLLVVLGEKKGTEIGLSSFSTSIPLVEIFKSIFSPLLSEEGPEETEDPEAISFLKKKLDELGLVYKKIESDCLAISKEREHLERHHKKQDREIDHQSFGKLLGYPETSVDYFASNPGTHYEDIDQFIDSETPWEPSDRHNQFRFINYIPAPNHTSLQCAIETSKERNELFETVDVSKYPKLKIMVESTLEKYEGFTDPSPSEYYGT